MMVIRVAMVAAEEQAVALLYTMQLTNSLVHFNPVVVMEFVSMGRLVRPFSHRRLMRVSHLEH